MIKVDIYGGLGNQLFQYALGRSISEKRGEQLQLLVDRFDNYKLRDFLLDNFNICAAVKSDNSKTMRLQRRLKSLLLRKILKCRYNGALGVYYDQDPYDYDPVVFETKANYFEGYWQSYKYFEDIQDSLIHELSLKVVVPEKNKQIITS
jgi:hypothetical protein